MEDVSLRPRGVAGRLAEMSAVITVAVIALPVLAAIICHEVAHGAVAYSLGDPTAAERGRLTLNPLPHIDPVGTVLLPAVLLLAPLVLGTRPFVFGWAKPVPVDYRRLRHPRRDGLLVALAGPATNLTLAAASTLVLGLLPSPVMSNGGLLGVLGAMAAASLEINCVLAVFNLLPVPPLDGGRVLAALLPAEAARAMAAVERVGIVVVLLLLLNTTVLERLVNPVLAFFLSMLPGGGS